MPEEIINNFKFKDSEYKVSKFINETYPGIKFHFNNETKELKIICKDKKKLETVFNILNVLNRLI